MRYIRSPVLDMLSLRYETSEWRYPILGYTSLEIGGGGELKV